mmetsp:Transcript_657/g.777  ORF Transcript_657/g.777 Transcript_657/m.777 type:complete len:119 (+) Transcript_657:95-451(+)
MSDSKAADLTLNAFTDIIALEPLPDHLVSAQNILRTSLGDDLNAMKLQLFTKKMDKCSAFIEGALSNRPFSAYSPTSSPKSDHRHIEEEACEKERKVLVWCHRGILKCAVIVIAYMIR